MILMSLDPFGLIRSNMLNIINLSIKTIKLEELKSMMEKDGVSIPEHIELLFTI